jgi:hypothetical protein
MFINVLGWALAISREGLIPSVRKMYVILPRQSTRLRALTVDKHDVQFHNRAAACRVSMKYDAAFLNPLMEQ